MANAAYLAEYNGGSLVTTAVLFLVLTYISVALRTYVRAVMTKGFMVDDWLMLAAQANFTLSCVFILLGIEHGLGRHDGALPRRQEILALMWQALATATYILNMMFIKLSIGFFLLRLAVQRRYRWTLYVSMVVILVWSLVLFFWDMFQCNPVAAQWDYTILEEDESAKCVSAQEVVNAAYALSVSNVITDWLYALLPIPMIWKVKMTPQAKITVVIVLGMGFFASIATLIRLKFLADLTDTSDLMFAGTDAMVWTLIEPGVAIVASSLVTIRPLLRQMRLKGFGPTDRGRSGTGGQGGSRTNRSYNSRRRGFSRSNSMPGYGPDNVKLHDLERGFVRSSSSSRTRSNKHGYSSQDTTLASRSSTNGCKTWGSGGRCAAALAIREDKDEDEDEVMTPVDGNGGVIPSGLSTPGSDVFVIQGAPPRTHQAHGQKGWRSEAPTSAEESEHIQGLTHPTHRDAGSRSSSRFSMPEFPIPTQGSAQLSAPGYSHR